KVHSLLPYHSYLKLTLPRQTALLSSAPTRTALAVSFCKMFEFPTGVGALVIVPSICRPWSAGGTADVVQVPGKVRTMEVVGEEFVEGRTINYLLLPLPAITSGLHLLSAYLPFLPLRLDCLLRYLVAELSRI
ncbi:MAG: hypothetical protein NXY57DRAFT_866252, partial [Lentinula lateritia]